MPDSFWSGLFTFLGVLWLSLLQRRYSKRSGRQIHRVQILMEDHVREAKERHARTEPPTEKLR